MNNTYPIAGNRWHDFDNINTFFTSSVVGLMSRFPTTDFTDAIVPTVNRTWTHQQYRSGLTLDGNNCEHLVDKFWLLGAGNLNLDGDEAVGYYNDIIYDTSKFSDIFSPSGFSAANTSRIKTKLASDGTDSGLVAHYWIRSADAEDEGWGLVGLVYMGGGISNTMVGGVPDGTGYAFGVAPACTIG